METKYDIIVNFFLNNWYFAIVALICGGLIVIPQIKEGAKEFIEKISENYELKLFTTRNKILASKWLIENEIDKYFKDITNTKDLAWLYIDDRCVNFNGDYSSLTELIENFKPWYK